MTGRPAARRRSATNHHAGLAAEAAVARHYEARGHSVLARRWRGGAGEIDLVLRHGDGLVAVEVKRSSSYARAAERLTTRQIRRVAAAAEEFAAGEPLGLLTPIRIDMATVSGPGEVRIVENVLAA